MIDDELKKILDDIKFVDKISDTIRFVDPIRKKVINYNNGNVTIQSPTTNNRHTLQRRLNCKEGTYAVLESCTCI